jgi:hypothetical protein
MKYELEDDLYTKICKITNTTYDGQAIRDKDDKASIWIPTEQIDAIIEDLIYEIDDLKEELETANQPKEAPVEDVARGNYF